MKKIIKNLLSQFSHKTAEIPFREELQKKINYKFSSSDLLKAALTHTSLDAFDAPSSPFERMEFLGDSILGLIVAEELFIKYPNSPEGKLSKIKSKVVSRKFLAKKAKEIDLGNYILLSSEAIQDGGKKLPSILSDAMESLICAIYLDGDIESAGKFIKDFILHNFEKFIKSDEMTNYKSILQEFTQSKFQKIPVYKIISEKGPDHHKIFTINVFIDNKLYGKGRGKNKKDAQQNAAKEACSKLKI